MASDEIDTGGHIVYLTAEQFQGMSKPVFAHHLSQSGRRLLWNLQGPLSSAISVLAEDGNPDGPREAYLHGNDRHPITNEPITEHPVVTLTVMEENLRDWEDAWWDLNYEGFDEDIQPAPEDLPPTFEPLVVTASNGEFVSIHDSVSAVHPWLMVRREQILLARHVADDDYMPGAVEERLLVRAQDTELVNAEDEEEWLAALRSIFENRGRQEEESAS